MTPDGPTKVIQWGTGNAGRHALRAIIERPDLELVGVHAWSRDKVGRDAADLCGLTTPTGVIATDDTDALLASDADCVSYMGQGESQPTQTLDDLARCLAAGKNVVNTALVFLVDPPSIPASIRDALERACHDGGSTLFTSGIDPGWSGDVLPVALAGASEWVDSIHVTEIMDYSTYPDPDLTGAVFGFGRPLDVEARLFTSGAIEGGWGGMCHLLGRAIGASIDELQVNHERLPAPDTFDTAMGVIEKGTCAGVWFEVRALERGAVRVVAAHVNRLRADIGPHWPSLSDDRSGYRIDVRGTPAYTCEIELHGPSGDHTEGGIIATAMRLVNAIPAVCAAAPGLVSPLDLPLFAGPARPLTDA